jgi:hypothetical protein
MHAVMAASAESWSNFAANVAQVGAILVGGWWAYTKFIRQREAFPRATLQQVISHRELNDEHTYLRVTLQIENTSTVLLPNKQARTDVRQVLPLSPEVERAIEANTLIPKGEREANWPFIGHLDVETQGKIEPGDGDQFAFDFIVPTEVTVVYVYSYVTNPTAENLGWTISSLYDLKTAGGQSSQRVENAPAAATP